MPRKPLPLGTHGEIRLYGLLDGKWVPKASVPKGTRLPKWRAITNYRDLGGDTSQVERTGTSATDATDRLREALSDSKSSHTTLTATARVEDAVPTYLERIKDDCAPTSYDRYVSALNVHVLPGIGRYLFTECTVSKLQHFDKNLVAKRRGPKSAEGKPAPPQKLSPSSRRIVREVVRGLMQVAVEDDVLDHNPVKFTRRITGGPKHAAKAMAADLVPAFFAKLDADARSRRADLPDIIRTLFGTGCRIGEALAMTWRYINFGDEPIQREAFDQVRLIPPRSVWINATITEPSGQGVVRSPVKTKKSNRVVGIPEFLYLVLAMRRPADATDDEPVFLNAGIRPWRSPTSVEHSIARMGPRIGYDGWLSHGGRKTAATVLYNAKHDDHEVADQFGHATGDFTRVHYVDGTQVDTQATAATLDRILSGKG